MEKFPKFFLIAFVALTMTFVSCNNEKDEPEPVNPDEPTTSDIIIPQSFGNYSIEVNDKGQVIKLKDSEDGSEYNFEYGNFSRSKTFNAVMRYRDKEDPAECNYDLYIQLNEYGYATYTALYDNDGDHYDSWECEYNSDGQLIQMNELGEECIYQFKYVEGNISEIIEKIYDEEPSITGMKYTNSMFNQPIPNKCGGTVFFEDFVNLSYIDEMEVLNYVGMLGKGTKDLPMSIYYDYDEGYRLIMEFYWELNSEQFPIKFGYFDDNGKPEEIITIRW